MKSKQTIRTGLGFVMLSTLPAFAIEAPKAAPAPPHIKQISPIKTAGETAQEEPEEVEAPRVIGYLGMGVSPMPTLLSSHLSLEKGKGVTVKSLDPTGPAALAGLTIDDIILQISGEEVNDEEMLSAFLAKTQPQQKIQLRVIHGGEKPKELEIILGRKTLVREKSTGKLNLAANERLQKLLASLPPEQANQFREALKNDLKERASQNSGAPSANAGLLNVFQDPAFRDLQRQLQGMLSQPDFPIPGMAGGIVPGNVQTFSLQLGGGGIQSQSTARILDENGSIEVRTDEKGRILKVCDPQGNVQWTGPWNQEAEKKAAPPEIRERIEQSGISEDTSNLEGKSKHINILRRLLGK